jgi:hypothetical protein
MLNRNNDLLVSVFHNYDENEIVSKAWQQKNGHCTPGILLNRTKDLQGISLFVPSQLHFAEFLCIVHDIFTDFFLHKEKRITNENMNKVRRIINQRLMYFVHWRANQIDAKKEQKKDWMAMFLANETWRNTLTSINGFFCYCQDSLNRNGSKH